MAGVATDVVNRLASLSAERTAFEAAWDQVDAVAATSADPNTGYSKAGALTQLPQPIATQRSKRLFDSTGANAVDRLGSGIEALVIPQSEYWHGLKITDMRHRKPTQTEQQWLEDQRDLMFETRYDADSGWVLGSQSCIRVCISHGNSFLWTEEGFDDAALIHYRYLPLRESYGAQNHRGVMNAYYRFYSLTAEQALGKFRERCPPKVRMYAEKAETKDQRFSFIQAIEERSALGRIGDKGAFKSLHIEVESKAICGEGTFYEFPVIDFRWMADGTLLLVI